MKQYRFVLKNEKEKFYKRISWLIITGNLALFIYIYIRSGFMETAPLFYTVLAIILMIVAYYFKKPVVKAGFLIISLGWFTTTTYWWAGLIILIYFLLDHIARRQLIVDVMPAKIRYPSWPEKEIKWTELNNIVFKDGLLTIDLKSNRLIQQNVINDNIDEKEFNDFCRQQLNK